MPPTRPRSAFRRLLAALGLGVALAGTANAAYVVGNWDPPFGAPFPNLGWRGTIKILVPDDCLQLGAGSHANPAACSAPLTVARATVQFYDVDDPLLATAETLDFSRLVAVDGFHLGSTRSFKGFSAFATGLIPSSTLLGSTGGSTNTAAFGLEFGFDGSQSTAVLGWTQRKHIDCGPATGRTVDRDCLPGGSGRSGSAPTVRFALFEDDGTPIVDADTQPIPEPLPLGLAAIGLLALGLSRHRRSPA